MGHSLGRSSGFLAIPLAVNATSSRGVSRDLEEQVRGSRCVRVKGERKKTLKVLKTSSKCHKKDMKNLHDLFVSNPPASIQRGGRTEEIVMKRSFPSIVFTLVVCTLLFGAAEALAQLNIYNHPLRVNQFGQPLEIWFDQENARQFCGEQGDGRVMGYLIGCGEDEQYFVNFIDGDWISSPSGSANQCYDIFDVIYCEVAAAVFNGPVRANQYGSIKQIWANQTNGNRYCQEEGYSSMANYTLRCGEDERSYVTFNGTSWVAKRSGSANQCYDLFASIICN